MTTLGKVLNIKEHICGQCALLYLAKFKSFYVFQNTVYAAVLLLRVFNDLPFNVCISVKTLNRTEESSSLEFD